MYKLYVWNVNDNAWVAISGTYDAYDCDKLEADYNALGAITQARPATDPAPTIPPPAQEI